MVTVEFAIGLIAAALGLAFAAGVVGVVILQGRCQDVATQVARHAARGDDRLEARARASAPKSAEIEVTESDGWVTVTVTAKRSWGRLGPVTVKGTATMPKESGASDEP